MNFLSPREFLGRKVIFMRQRLFLILGLTSLSTVSVLAETPREPLEKSVQIAQSISIDNEVLSTLADASEIYVPIEQLKTNQSLTEQLLNQAIEQGNVQLMMRLLPLYQQFSTADPLLIRFCQAKIAKNEQHYTQAIAHYRAILAQASHLTPVRMQLAISLFQDYQNNAAETEFENVLSDSALPADIVQLAKRYLAVLHERNRWKVSFGVQYLSENNVNNAANDSYIENTPFRKNASMLPQKAHGLGYQLSLERDFNLWGAHYLNIENGLFGKSYWDNHLYDEITNRFYLGYVYKQANQKLALRSFYEQQWYNGHRYKRENGGRIDFQHRFSPQWQFSSALEYGRNFYSNRAYLNGSSKLVSNTLTWQPNIQSSFSLGSDFLAERSQIRHYGYNLATLRLLWRQEWKLGIVSRLNFSISQRHYRDNLSLGRAFHFDKRRRDKIYMIGLTLWKQDWEWQGITPKLNLKWKKQVSNFNSLYSYTDKSINLLLEKTF